MCYEVGVTIDGEVIEVAGWRSLAEKGTFNPVRVMILIRAQFKPTLQATSICMQRNTLTDKKGVGLKTQTGQLLIDSLKQDPNWMGIKFMVVFATKHIWSFAAVSRDMVSGKFAHVLDNPLPFREMWIDAQQGCGGQQGCGSAGILLLDLPGEVILYLLGMCKTYTNNSALTILEKFYKYLRPRKV
jgi:hypothetical protein